MSKKKRAVFIVVWVALMVIVLVAALLVGGSGESESIKVVMRDAVLHGTNKVSLFGIKDVNPAYISSLIVCGALLVFAAVIRIFVIPKFKMVPGKFQMLLEQLVTFFDNLAKTSSPHKNSFLGAYVFAAGVYIFVGTLFELFGIQAATTAGGAISLPAPLSDINAAIMLGCLSYLVILSGGIAGAKIKGVGRTLKEFSLPISMSFRLFGALLSGLLVTELVLQHQPELRSPGIRGNNVHAAARAYSGVRPDYAHGNVLRRGFRTSRQGGKKAPFQINQQINFTEQWRIRS